MRTVRGRSKTTRSFPAVVSTATDAMSGHVGTWLACRRRSSRSTGWSGLNPRNVGLPGGRNEGPRGVDSLTLVRAANRDDCLGVIPTPHHAAELEHPTDFSPIALGGRSRLDSDGSLLPVRWRNSSALPGRICATTHNACLAVRGVRNPLTTQTRRSMALIPFIRASRWSLCSVRGRAIGRAAFWDPVAGVTWWAGSSRG